MQVSLGPDHRFFVKFRRRSPPPIATVLPGYPGFSKVPSPPNGACNSMSPPFSVFSSSALPPELSAILTPFLRGHLSSPLSSQSRGHDHKNPSFSTYRCDGPFVFPYSYFLGTISLESFYKSSIRVDPLPLNQISLGNGPPSFSM